MCIVCEIKADLSKSKATAEEASAILSKVETLARCMGDVIDVVEAAHARKADVFNADELATIAKAEELFTTQTEGMAGLAALLGGRVNVETVAVVPENGESIEEAISRTMTAKTEGRAQTKH